MNVGNGSNLYFEKYHVNGNNFIIIDERRNVIKDDLHSNLSHQLCDLKQSIGADGILFLSDSGRASVRMRIFEPDGSESDMCGNGIRCIALYLNRLTGNNEFSIETNTGLFYGDLTGKKARLNAGKLQDPHDFVSSADTFEQITDFVWKIVCRGRDFYIVNIGEPHAVTIHDGFDLNLRDFLDFARAPLLFPRGINLNVITKVDDNTIRNRTFERGVWNYTTSCGTGSISCAVIAKEILGLSSDEITVINDIGQQQIQFVNQEIHALATPRFVFSGRFEVQ